MTTKEKDIEKGKIGAVFMYGGILDAYEAVGTELIGSNVLDEHVLPRMVYYVREFLPELFKHKKQDDTELIAYLRNFMTQYKEKIATARTEGSGDMFTMDEVWELRAAIFGYESVFIDILGENAIKNYVFKRIADILAAYLPDAFLAEDLTLEEKLQAYVKYITDQEFVAFANYKVKGDVVQIAANRCAFAKIHDSEAYRGQNVRFCPWGMIGSAILTNHYGQETKIKSCLFTTLGSVTDVERQ